MVPLYFDKYVERICDLLQKQTFSSFRVQCMILWVWVTKTYLSSPFRLPPKPCQKPCETGHMDVETARITSHQQEISSPGTGRWQLIRRKWSFLKPVLREKKTGNTSFSLHIDPLSILWMFNLLARREVHPQQLWEIKSMKMCHWFTYQTPSSKQNYLIL